MRKIASVFIILLLASPFFFAQPKKVEATIPSLVIGDLIQTIKEFAVDTIITVIQQRLLDKMIKDTVTWANGGFDGEPGFINNWDDFLKGTEHNVLSGAFGLANTTLDDIMSEYGVGGGIGDGDPGNQAQNNYNLWVSGELDAARMIAGTIANVGSRSLNLDPLQALIQGEGRNIRQVDEAFGENSGLSFLAALDPHNTSTGLSTLVERALMDKVSTTVTRTVQDVQTENKFLNISVCEEYTTGSDGEEICARRTTTTPGNLVASEIQGAIGADRDRSIVVDELSDILGKALGRVITNMMQKGLNSLVSGGNNSSLPTNIGGAFGSDYQSGYDVLGLNFGSGSGSGGSGGTGTGSGVGGGTGSGGTGEPDIFGDGVDSSLPYIGGPEDQSGLWTGGPEIIIDLQAVLESSINLTRQDIANHTEVERIARQNSDKIIKLDRCVPGPGPGWEDRIRDLLSMDGGDDNTDRVSLKKAQFSEMKASVNDTFINIPGATRMLALVDSFIKQGDAVETEASIIRKRKAQVLANLLNIQSAVLQDFNQYRMEYHPMYPLFAADWEKLTQAQKLQIFSLEYPEGQGPGGGIGLSTESGPAYLVSPYYLFKPGETPESVLTDNEPAAMNAVLSFAWNLWQEKKGEEPATDNTPSGVKQKSNIRYRYYIMENDISTQSDVLKSALKIDEMIENSQTIESFLHDCLQLKHFVTGISKEILDQSFLQPFTNAAPIPLISIFSAHGRNVRAINFNGKTDQVIKDYLIAQRNLQNQGLPSDFMTDVITGEGSIETSILYFETEEEKLQYFTDFYSFENMSEQEDWEYNTTSFNNPNDQYGYMLGNAISISHIYVQDYNIANWPRGGHGRGLLFCRISTNFDSRGWSDRQHTPDCVKDWYFTSNMEYRAMMSGV